MAIKKIAIIGASTGQIKLYEKAHQLGLFVIGFAWEKGAVCKSLADVFYPISIIEKEKIVEVCKEEEVCGVVSNASDLPSLIAAYVAEQLNLNSTPYDVMFALTNKSYVRRLSKDITGLSKVNYYIYDGEEPLFLPCIVKPIKGGGKAGLSFVGDLEEFQNAIVYAKENTQDNILIEEFVSGREISVESISYKGNHYVIQITDKENTGAPHFVELSHHQPSNISKTQKEHINMIVQKLLSAVGFTDGATHIELKISGNDIYLIEINPRGGGDEISNRLVELSTGFDYVEAMIRVAVNDFFPPYITNKYHSGIYFLTKQTEKRLPFFLNAKKHSWFVDGEITSYDLENSLGNSMKNGFVIYQSNSKIEP